MKRKISLFLVVSLLLITIIPSTLASSPLMENTMNGDLENTITEDLVSIQSYLGNDLQANDVDEQSLDIISELPAGRITSDVTTETGIRFLEIIFPDDSECAIVRHENDITICFTTADDYITQYDNGELKIDHEPISNYISDVEYKLKPEYAQLLENEFKSIIGPITQSELSRIGLFDAKVMPDGEIVLPDRCYTITESSTKSLKKSSSTSAASVTRVFPAKPQDSIPYINDVTPSSGGTQTKYSSELGKNVSTKVKIRRNNYIYESGLFKKVSAGLTLIKAAGEIGVNGDYLKIVLDLYGLLDSVQNVISAFEFPDRCDYRATFGKSGWAYDTTMYNKYVRMKNWEGTGLISMTWDVTDENERYNYYYRVTSQPSVSNTPNSTVLNNAHTVYVQDIVNNGYCTYLYTE